MKSIVLDSPITVAGIAFASWERGRLRDIDCVKVGDVFYFVPLRNTSGVVVRDLERTKAVHASRVVEWAPDYNDLPQQLLPAAGVKK